ncbi:MAG: HD domain-containing protein, partial [Candidatus Hydrogenedentes bacterium]|nr:HD domain-containing protein [Candidatus Hydrogenedentota bacterium]
GAHDPQWFAEYPPRLMELFWECGRRMAPLDHVSSERVKENLHLVGSAFQSDDLVRRFFTALCSRPHHAGLALRQAAETGLLARYIPEFAEVEGVVRYEDFHSYPVDEHTLRAVEAIAALQDMEGPIGQLLQRTLEHLRDPHILMIAILCHDLGKAGGEEHVEEGVRLVWQICERMGMSDEDTERIAFLVEHHMLMNNIAMYRDTDDLDIVSDFAKTMKTADRLQALLLLSYADLSAVGPNVWTEWKGALLAKLYLKSEQILLGRAHFDEAFWLSPKAKAIESAASDAFRPHVSDHVQQLGERYFVAFSPREVLEHMECLREARKSGLAVHCVANEDTGTSDVVVCTRNCHGLFAKIAGCLSSQLADVRRASVFTTPDGYAVDSFTVVDAANRRTLTAGQVSALTRTLHDVLLSDEPVQTHVDRARNRLFSLNHAHAPVPTRIGFDNEASRTDTVLDVETGDRTGLLYDIARVLAGFGIDFQSSHVATDARQVRDSFYIRMGDTKIEDEAIQADLRFQLTAVIQPTGLGSFDPVIDNKL